MLTVRIVRMTAGGVRASEFGSVVFGVVIV
jgi:hypothetical protein